MGFEGGQMLLQRRVPKSGFVSRQSFFRTELYLSDLEKLNETHITRDRLIALGVISPHIKQVKVIASGTLTRQITVQGLRVSRGAREAIVALNGTVEV